jgi:hypothetical protein
MANGPVPMGMFVCHRCDTPRCVNPAHLFLGTQTDNMRDCSNKGRSNKPRGEEHPRARLTAGQVVEIRKRHSAGDSLKAIARAFGISWHSVSPIVSGQAWSHVKEGA